MIRHPRGIWGNSDTLKKKKAGMRILVSTEITRAHHARCARREISKLVKLERAQGGCLGTESRRKT